VKEAGTNGQSTKDTASKLKGEMKIAKNQENKDHDNDDDDNNNNNNNNNKNNNTLSQCIYHQTSATLPNQDREGYCHYSANIVSFSILL
jgi:hypothetical protein